jgi:hypothetical protein
MFPPSSIDPPIRAFADAADEPAPFEPTNHVSNVTAVPHAEGFGDLLVRAHAPLLS